MGVRISPCSTPALVPTMHVQRLFTSLFPIMLVPFLPGHADAACFYCPRVPTDYFLHLHQCGSVPAEAHLRGFGHGHVGIERNNGKEHNAMLGFSVADGSSGG